MHYKNNYERWVEKYGDDIANIKQAEYLKNMSKAILCADMSLQKKRAGETFAAMNQSNKGKKLEEIYGEEKAKEIKRNQSIRYMGENNPAFGKVYKKGGRSVKGYYKGLFFRSLFEYSFMKHLELLGFDLANDIDYECFKVPYQIEGKNRTYTIDFYVKSINAVYEVKPNYQVKIMKDTDVLAIKIKAAQNFFTEKNITFSIVTENDFQKITFAEAKLDQNIKFDERTFEYFTGK